MLGCAEAQESIIGVKCVWVTHPSEQLWDLLHPVPLRQLRALLPQQVGEGA